MLNGNSADWENLVKGQIVNSQEGDMRLCHDTLCDNVPGVTCCAQPFHLKYSTIRQFKMDVFKIKIFCHPTFVQGL